MKKFYKTMLESTRNQKPLNKTFKKIQFKKNFNMIHGKKALKNNLKMMKILTLLKKKNLL